MLFNPRCESRTYARRGLPWSTQIVYDQRDCHLNKRDRRQIKRLKYFQILWPLKILTVLFHEVSLFGDQCV